MEKCLFYKMTAEQILYINNFNSYLDAKAIAIGFLSGLTFDETDAALKIRAKTQEIKDVIDNTIKEKYNNISDIDENFNIETNWFDKNENER